MSLVCFEPWLFFFDDASSKNQDLLLFLPCFLVALCINCDYSTSKSEIE